MSWACCCSSSRVMRIAAGSLFNRHCWQRWSHASFMASTWVHMPVSALLCRTFSVWSSYNLLLQGSTVPCATKDRWMVRLCASGCVALHVRPSQLTCMTVPSHIACICTQQTVTYASAGYCYMHAGCSCQELHAAPQYEVCDALAPTGSAAHSICICPPPGAGCRGMAPGLCMVRGHGVCACGLSLGCRLHNELQVRLLLLVCMLATISMSAGLDCLLKYIQTCIGATRLAAAAWKQAVLAMKRTVCRSSACYLSQHCFVHGMYIPCAPL